MLLYVWLNLVT